MATTRGPKPDVPAAFALHANDVMHMDLTEFIRKCTLTVRAPGRMRFLLELDHKVTDEPRHNARIRVWYALF